jgi:hypothetical protein
MGQDGQDGMGGDGIEGRPSTTLVSGWNCSASPVGGALQGSSEAPETATEPELQSLPAGAGDPVGKEGDLQLDSARVVQ